MPELKSLVLSDLSDDQLIARFKRNGDQRLVGELFERYYHLIYGACLKQLSNQADSKDATMNVFEKILVKLPNAKVESFNSWIYVVIQNECLSILRKHKIITNLKGNLKNIENSPEKSMEFEGVARLSMDKEVPDPEDRLEWAISKLKKEQQSCIRLFFFEKKSYAEIVDQTKFTPNQVKSYLQNGKQRLKYLLEMRTS